MAIINNKYILFAATALTLAACGNDTVTDGSVQPTAKEEVPVTVAFADANVSTKTRAAGHDFAAKDQLIAHIRHVVETNSGQYQEKVEDLSQTRIFTVNDNPTMTQTADDTNTYQTTDITPDQKIYWDDFNSSEDYSSNDIRSNGHGLQVEWGYCFNGYRDRQFTTYTDEITDLSIGDQQATGYQKYDILWAKSQKMVSYLHGNSADDATRNGLIIPYTHAMSKMTIKLTADEGFWNSTKIFDDAMVYVTCLNTVGTFKASTATVSGAKYTDDTKSITMYRSISDDGKTATFECVFVPTKLEAQTDIQEMITPVFALITGVDGNIYNLYLTQDIMTSWGLTGDDTTTKSGVNYQINATLKKAKVDVTAQLADWNTEESSGDAKIYFKTDLTNVDPSTDLTDGTSYDIFRGTTTSDLTNVTTRKYTAADEEATSGAWTNNPEIYWANATQSYYFRGLAKLEENKITSVGGSKNATQGTDLLWATTAKHTGTNNSGTSVIVEEGAAISPRTSHVPMTFSHAMSKVTFELKTTEDKASKVNLEGATISVPDLYTTGSIDVATGAITGSGDKSALENVTSNTASIVIPQDVKSKVITITLKDGTTYRYTLGESETWEGGKSYTYTVTLQKEKIDFRALIKEWTKETGSGNATLDWD